MVARRSFVVGVASITAIATGLGGSLAAAADDRDSTSGPIAVEADDYQSSPPVRSLDDGAGDGAGSPSARVNPLAGEEAPATGGADVPGGSDQAPGRTPMPGLTFEGTGNPTGCGGCSPPDTTGDVGPNHYIQMVNATKVAIYDKAGTLLEPPFDLGTLWSSGPCTGNLGDPQVLYDEAADRWLLAQFQSSNRLCFAISQTADPQGAYHLFNFPTPQFPDYFKVGVWPTGYYVSANESSYTAYAFDREKMLAGDATASFVRFAGQTNFLLPADVDGPTAPPTQGGLFYTFKDNSFHGGGADRIELFQLTPDFATPASSTFSLIETIPVTAFTYTVCGFFDFTCIPQSGTPQMVDAVSEWPMQRFAYRRFAGHEALVGTFTVGGGSAAADGGGPGTGAMIRWFELRDTGTGWALHQEGNHDPGGGLNRFMGSIAMDGDGNIALGYSASSSSAFPSIRYASREASDPLGTLEAEVVMQAGSGSQTGSDRWGDYSAMNVDPADDCTFWYTNQYYPVSAATTWKTRIGNFKYPSCSVSPPVMRTLTVTGAGAGSGFVTSSPVGIDCGHNPPGTHTDCTEPYPDGTVVTLTATPAAGSTFGGFTGAGCAGAVTCNVTMDAGKNVTATFNTSPPPPTHTLTVAGAGTGSGFVDSSPVGIDCGHNPPGTRTDCTHQYANGTGVLLTAHPAAGSNFGGFTGGGCSGGGLTCALTMDGARHVTATFQPSNEFTIDKVKRNKRKGTATITVTVPGPGELALGGKNIKPQRPGRQASKRASDKPVTAAGKATLKVKAKGKAKRKLRRKGKAKVTAKITYTPTGGTPNTKTQKVKLKRRR
jgi:hypothetical protein